MKKSLVLAMAMALGVTASAYAANPFSDVPAGHWAYDSIDKLAAAGVIDGMGDGTYQGDKTMTRYEMAQIVAKAMAKGANVDKLAAEFADELDNLGVRVANLEKKADNVKISGVINYYYKSAHNGYETASKQSDKHWLRSDLTLSGKINEDWTYTALIRNEQQFQGDYAGKGEEDPFFQRAYVDGKLGGLKVRAGRWHKVMADNAVYGHRQDGVEVAYGKDVKVTLGYSQLAASNSTKSDGKATYAEIDWKVNKALAVDLDYIMVKDDTNRIDGNNGDANILNVGAKYSISKNVKLAGQYLHASEGEDKDGWVAGINYKGANKAKVGSYGIYAKYYDLSDNHVLENAGVGTMGIANNKGYRATVVGANYAFAKNIVGTVEYWNGKYQGAANKQEKLEDLTMNLVFSF